MELSHKRLAYIKQMAEKDETYMRIAYYNLGLEIDKLIKTLPEDLQSQYSKKTGEERLKLMDDYLEKDKYGKYVSFIWTTLFFEAFLDPQGKYAEAEKTTT